MNRFLFIAVLIWASLGIRLVHDHLLVPDRTPLPPRVPLSEFPMDALELGWAGAEVPLEADVLRKTRVSDYLQRRYRHPGRQLSFYVGYVSGRVPDAVHHPGICFPGGGHYKESEAIVTLPESVLGKTVRFTQYVWKSYSGGRTYTLSSFYYNGKFEPRAQRLKAERIMGVRYFAVITLSCNVAGSLGKTQTLCQNALLSALPELIKHFPGKRGANQVTEEAR